VDIPFAWIAGRSATIKALWSQRVYIANFNAVATPTVPPMMKYLNAKQLEERTTISHRTWLLWAKKGKVPSYKVGRRVVFKENEIQEFIELGLSNKVIEDRKIQAVVDELIRKAETKSRVDRMMKKVEDASRNYQKAPAKREERRDKEGGVTNQKTPKK